MLDIKKELEKARQNKQELPLEDVAYYIYRSVQVSKRNNPTGAYSELTLCEIDSCLFAIVHNYNKIPDMRKVSNFVEGDYKATVISEEVFTELTKAIDNYREESLDKEYVNMYSYLWGWCQGRFIDLKELDLF